MHLTFTSSSLSTQKLQLQHPDEFAGDFQERVTVITDTWGKFDFRESWFKDVCICYTVFNKAEPCTINLQSDNFCWLMNFVLEGKFKIDRVMLKEKNSPAQQNPYLNADVLMDSDARVLTICLTRNFVSKFVKEEFLDDKIYRAIVPVNIGDHHNTRLNSIVKDILNADQPGNIRRIFLESKILELLSIQLQAPARNQATPKGLNKEDIARLHEAKLIIAQNMQTPCSLIELAKRTGLNDFKLKKGFKAIFGNTVFGYLFQLRMDTAYNLLRNNKSVSEVAEIIGYKNPHHFTAAFKKQYNMLPSQVNKITA
jgi:AraC-like DNA-binding protein